MKKLCLGMVLAVGALLLIPLSASAANYETFVGCNGLSENPVPSHACLTSDFPAAYFESDVDTEYEVCIETPTAELCSEEEPAEAEVLYGNSFPGGLAAGDYFAYWYVGGIEVGFWAFRLDSPPPPPAPVPAVAAPSPPAAVALGPSPACLKAQLAVTKVKNRLKKAGPKQKTKIRGKLRKAKATAKRLC